MSAGIGFVILSGCGGSSSDPSPPVTNKSVGGIWSYAGTQNGVSVTSKTVVLEDGEFYAVSKNLSNNCVGIVQGQLTVSNGDQVTGSGISALVQYSTLPNVNAGCTYPDGSNEGTFSVIGGTVAQQSTLTVTSQLTTVNGTQLPANTATFSFVPLYLQGSSLAQIAGNYTAPSGATMTIGANGSVFEQDPSSGCVINGSVSLVDAAYDAYRFTITYASCMGSASLANGTTFSGLAVVDNTVSPNELDIAGASGGTLIAAVLLKQ
jgi:hypothetical protein